MNEPTIPPTHEAQPAAPADHPRQTGRLRSMLKRVRRKLPFQRPRRSWAMLIANPAAGQATPDLRLLNRLFVEHGYEWKMAVTNHFGDGARLAEAAAESGASIVAAYGGDGTVMDVAAGLVGRRTPLAILPGGTGNALAKELMIPLDLGQAASLMVSPEHVVRPIDIGRVGSHLFLLRFGVGLEAQITRTADRAMKDRLGPLAYVAATVQAWSQAAISRYRLEMDGSVVELEGLACMVANAATLGIPGINISPRVRIDDGLLDVFVIRRADLAELSSLMASVIGAQSPAVNSLPHYQCRELRLRADPPQGIDADGEDLGQTPVKVSVLAAGLRVITPGASGEGVHLA